ncbi:MAG TPA: ADP-forming succinate--CoA ligase subunit beta, partial [Thermoleophilia bacterium]
MDLLEYEGKRLFADAGLPVLPSRVAGTVAEAEAAADDLGLPVAVKAQVKTGGRGKAGGVRVCRTAAEVTEAATEIMGMSIRGHVVRTLLVEQGVEVERELYLAISSSRALRGPVLIFCREGGVDIEEVARRDPSALVRTPIDPLLGLCDYQVRDVVAAACLGAAETPGGVPAGKALAAVVRLLWRLYHDRDATLTEVNPLVLTKQGEVVCLDSKVTIDDNALYRQADLKRDEGEDGREGKARRAGLAFVPLEGDIGVLGNGAGLVMSTIDQIAAAGGHAADFCDIGGGARTEVVAAALELVLSAKQVSALLVSVFGGITRCDEVARGLVQVLSQTCVDVPVVVRLEGNAAAG